MQRRQFIKRLGTSAAAFSLVASARGSTRASANDRVNVAVIGVRGRGGGLLSTFGSLDDADVKYVCDVDQSVLDERTARLEEQTGRRAEKLTDFRRALDDPAIDAIVLGTPDHWHGLPTIMACQAGKDVYVEKPDSHNATEGRTMVAAAKKHGRIIQLGTQSRSGEQFAQAMEYIAAGHLGRPVMARAWESARQGSIGHPPDSAPPAGVDYDMWLGPAPKRPFNPRRFHSNWRWFFDYGTGDLGNDGVHRIDVALWGLETAIRAAGQEPLARFPKTVHSVGGKLYFDDDQQWPDTLMVNYDFGSHVLNYEMRIWNPYPLFGHGEGAAIYGDQGYIIIANREWHAFGPKDEHLAEGRADHNDRGHAQNFIDCMRSRQKPTADLETVGHRSSMLCHLGNAAWRAGQSLNFDPESYTFPDQPEADRFLARESYRAPWHLPKISEV